MSDMCGLLWALSFFLEGADRLIGREVEFVDVDALSSPVRPRLLPGGSVGAGHFESGIVEDDEEILTLPEVGILAVQRRLLNLVDFHF